MNDREQRQNAARFAAEWMPRQLGREKQDTHSFWLSLLSDVFDVKGAYRRFIDFEKRVSLPGRHVGYIDGYIPDTKVLIEQKGRGVSLTERALQSDGSLLDPYEQAQRYAAALNLDEQPRWIVTCNFDEFRIYDQNDKQADPVVVSLENFSEGFRSLSVLVDLDANSVPHEVQLSVSAGALIGRIYRALRVQYGDKIPPAEVDRSLNVLCVRLAFCLYAEDSGLFGRHAMFHDYMRESSVEDMRQSLISLFEVLDTPVNERDPYLKESLSQFPYVDGGLFHDRTIVVPPFSEDIARLLLVEASEGFDWKNISPTIFGAVFESTLNPETQRKGGMHYTSVENIQKVINPLFMDGLRAQYKDILTRYKDLRTRNRHLQRFQKELGTLTFLDPACGSGNFLTETYLELRRLENEALRVMLHGQQAIGFDFSPIQVHIDQFYGIEINDFAVTVARTALWIAEHQMMQETEDIVQQNLDFLPLKSYSNIKHGNALRMPWTDLIEASDLNYVIGNPPFVGARNMSPEQKDDLVGVFGKGWKNAGDIDYVGCWFRQADRLMAQNPSIKTAFVATNSICQGQQVANLWAPILTGGACINFAWRTFVWDSEAEEKAHVHCVIIGFSRDASGPKYLFDADRRVEARHINAYLLDAEDVFIYNRSSPICDVPQVGIGNKPIDGGNYLFTQEQKDAFVRDEPQAEKYFKRWLGAEEFINAKVRYCLWLGDCPPQELQNMPQSRKRVEAVRALRLASKSEGTRKLAEKPRRFHVENMPAGTSIIIPETSSERRKYIPMGFVGPETLCSNLVRLVPNATLYEFGVLMSSVHMAWVRAICGRLEMRYRYSVNLVYNNFPWPTVSADLRQKIEAAAQGILDARGRHPGASLAALYDLNAMPDDLLAAHEANDRLVMQAYGFKSSMSETEVVAALLRLFETELRACEAKKAQKSSRGRKAQEKA